MLKNRILASGIIMLFCAVMAFGQGTTGQISGTVSDPNGAVIAGASVKVTNTGTNFTREATTNGDGSYSISLLPPGNYAVEITATNFNAYKSTVVVNISQTTTVESVLGVGTGDLGVVEVQAPTLQTETVTNGRTVSGETIRQLPLPTRNFQQLLTLSPGAQTGVTNSTDLGRGDDHGQRPAYDEQQRKDKRY